MLSRASLALLLLAAPLAARAQVLGEIEPPSVRRSIRVQADSLFETGRHQAAIELLSGHLARSPGSSVGHMLMARVLLVLGEDAEDDRIAGEMLGSAAEHGRRATELDPADTEARYVTLAAIGAMGLRESSPRERARFGTVVHEEALRLLEIDPGNGGAHNVLGRVYMELAALSWFSRVFARMWMGADIVDRATWEAAEHHLHLATELEPRRNFHFLDLGALLIERDRAREARPVLEAAIAVPLEVPEQAKFRERAGRLLDDIRRRPGG